MCKGDNMLVLGVYNLLLSPKWSKNLFNAALKTVPATYESQGAEIMLLGFPHFYASVVCSFWQVERKRHIGNDIVTIVFQEGDDASSSFKPSMIRSHFTRILHMDKDCQRSEVVISDERDVSPLDWRCLECHCVSFIISVFLYGHLQIFLH